MKRAYKRLTEEEKKNLKNRLSKRFGPSAEVGVIKEVPIPNKYDAKIGDIAILIDYSPEEPYCKVQFLDMYTRLLFDFPSGSFRILNKETIRNLKSGSLEVIVEDNYAN